MDLGDCWFEVVFAGERRLGWNHDADRVSRIARCAVVLYDPEKDLLGGFGQHAYKGSAYGTVMLIRPSWDGKQPCSRTAES
ncbi:MAG: hypothetical protein ACTH1D_11605 [Mycobacteriaceae bacterium]|uniref:hypothetical protein n=1 Tax=Corynebacterium sp. TaxID=1720 RepID=UPI003F9E9267